MAGTAFKDARVVKKINEGFTPVLVDFDAEKRLAKEQGISTLPTIAYALAEDMDVIEWTQDYQEPDALLAALDEVLAGIAEGDGGDLVDEE